MPKTKFPPWLKKRFRRDKNIDCVTALLKKLTLHTVCQSARCPNLCECFHRYRTTFLILGDICTRNCRFCGVKKGKPLKVDAGEPKRLASAVKRLGLKNAVITSVTRDDLPDGGAGHFAKCVYEIKKIAPHVKTELLIPDFKGNQQALKKVLDSKPDMLAHNLETVPRFYKGMRPEADYRRSLAVLQNARQYSPKIIIKSGIMVGLGETESEVLGVISDLKRAGCNMLTIGQYLRPSGRQAQVRQFVRPQTFEKYKKTALGMGFDKVASGAFIRSSYIS